MQLQYLDFVITIDGKSNGNYPTRVRSPVGEAQSSFHFPFSLSPTDAAKQSVSSDNHRLGCELFERLFLDDIRSLYYESRRAAEHQSKGLRIKLILPPDLARLPWELLYDEREGDYIALSQHTPIVRYLEVAQPSRSLTVESPLHILGIAVSPVDMVGLDLATEKLRLERALAPLGSAVHLTWLTPPTWQTLLQAMRQQSWHVLHFVGHGAYDQERGEGQLFFANQTGTAQPISAVQFARLVADQRTLRLVTLNACEGAMGAITDHFAGTAATLIRRGLPAVVAMQFPISDGAAIEFCSVFYSALAEGTPIDSAVTDARKSISLALAESWEWVTPALYMRAPDGNIFNRASQSPMLEAQEQHGQDQLSPVQPQNDGRDGTFQTTVKDSKVGEVINVHTLHGGLTINKNK